MPRFPTYQRQEGLNVGSTGRNASLAAFAAPANALQDAGGAMQSVGAALSERIQKIQNTSEDAWFSKARADTALAMQNAQNELRQSSTGGAEGYTDQVRARYEELRQQTLGAAPSDRARAMFDEWSLSYSANVVGDAATFQAQSTLAQRETNLGQAMVAHSQAVLGDPSSYETVYKRAMDDLEGAKQWMTPEQEAKARQTVEQQLQLARAQGAIQRDPQGFLQDIGVTATASGPQAWRDAIAKIESAGSGDYAAVGPTHEKLGRALGRYQIMEANIGPWSQKHLGRRVSAEEFMANPAIQDAIFDAEFGSYVQRFGLEGAAQAWFAGPGGVGKTGRKDSLGTDVGSYGQKFLAALGNPNPNVAGNPQYASLDVNQLLGLQQAAQTQLAQVEQQQKAAATAQLAEIKGAFQLGIATGDTSVTPQAILSSPLPDSDKATLINSYNEKTGDLRLASDAITRMDAGSALNPFNSNDRRGVSLAYDAATGGGSLFGDGNAQAVLGYMYGRSGIVPQTAMNEIRAGLLSSDPKTVGAAASVARQLADIDMGGLEAAENGNALIDAATTYRHLTESIGLTNEQAGQRMVDMMDPEKQRQRDALLKSKPVKDRIAGIDASEVRDIFDPGTFGFDPDLGETPMAEAAMLGEYRSIFEESIVEAAGDEELAKKLADQRFMRNYGPSPLTLAGEGVITRLPPERVYQPGPDGTHAYIGEQAREALSMEGVTADEVFLEYYADTETDFRAGKPPRYRVWYKQDGRLEMYNLPFYAEAPTMDFTANRENRAANTQRRVVANERQERIRQDAAANAQDLGFPSEEEQMMEIQRRDAERIQRRQGAN